MVGNIWLVNDVINPETFVWVIDFLVKMSCLHVDVSRSDSDRLVLILI